MVKIVDEHLDFALVLEDVFINNTAISKLVVGVVNIKQPWHCIKLAKSSIKQRIFFGKNG